MNLADDIREFTRIKYIEPARMEGKKTIQIRTGDVHREMSLHSGLPAIASALGTKKFESYARVCLAAQDGLHIGANLIFTFKIQ